MKMGGWTRSDAIAIFALLIAFGGFYVSWRVYRRGIKAERPIFWAQLPYPQDGSRGGWYLIEVRVRNRAAHPIECEQIKVLRPRRAVLATYWEATEQVIDSGRELKTNILAGDFGRTARMRLAASHAGKETPRNTLIKSYGAGDTDDEQFFVHCAPPFWARSSRRPIKLSMRITWRSKDESSRRQTSDVYMELMPASTTADKAT
jgi:hypothetical protein